MVNEPIAIKEVVKNLLFSSDEVKMFRRDIRNQGHSKYLAVSRLLPRHFKIVQMYKLAEKDNAVLVLFIDPTQKGYNVSIW